jgi:hypothetical protein
MSVYRRPSPKTMALLAAVFVGLVAGYMVIATAHP